MANPPLHIVHTENSCGWGGQEIRVLTEAAGMIRRGHRVTLICPAEARIYSAAQQRGIPVVALPIARKNLKGLFALRRWLAEHRPDVVNTHSSTDTWLTALARLTLNGLAVVRTRHISAPVPCNWPSRWLYRHAVDRIATTGEALRSQLVKKLDLPPDHVISVPTGIDLARYCPQPEEIRTLIRAELGISPAAKVIGIVATLRSWKGHTYLLQAFSSLAAKDPELELLIAGDGPMREQIAGWAAQSGVAGRIHLTGQREDVPAILAAMDVFVLPSYANEGVPQALMQAMAAGLPVVSTHVGAIDELVADKLSGFLVTPKNAVQLEEKLAELLQNPELCARFGQAGREIVAARYSLDAMLDAMEGVFYSCVQR